jgi:hypothetical protein
MGARISIRSLQSSRWFLICLIWLQIGMFDASDTVFSMRAEGHHHAWLRLFITLLLSWLPWTLATPFILYLGRRHPFRFTSFPGWLPHLGACAFIGLGFAAWSAALEELLDPWLQAPATDPFARLMIAKFFTRLVSFLIVYAAIIAIGYVLDSRQRIARQETESARISEQLTRAQLDALRRQIEPHFLFNTLNGITALIREERNEAAIDMLTKLSDVLRRVVEGSCRHEVALGEEIEFLKKYLDIQKVRFAERLRLSVHVPDELLAAQVPSLLLQPIVENSIKHGIAKSAHGGAIRIGAFRSDRMLTLNVYNDGPQLPPDTGDVAVSTGISNLRTRLHSFYGTAFSLSMENKEPSGVEVSVSFPFREN